MGRHLLKILYISRGYSTHDHRFLRSFADAGWQTLFLPLLDARLESRGLPGSVNVVAWPHTNEPKSKREFDEQVPALREILRDSAADAVVAGPVQHGAYLASLAGARPLVSVSWGSDMLVDANANAFNRQATRHALANSDAAVGDCDAVRNALTEFSTLPDDAIVIFPWGVDVAQFLPGVPSLRLREKLGWIENEVLISTRSLEPVYAIDVLVRAFARVVAQLPTARLLLLGDGSLAGEISALVDQLGLTEFVHRTGRIDHEKLATYFREADVYVSSALSDGTSVSLLEAMGCGLPAIVSSCHGNLEWVTPGINGALAPPGDAGGLSSAMLSILRNRESWAGMRDANVSLVRARANWSANFPRLVETIEKLAGFEQRAAVAT